MDYKKYHKAENASPEVITHERAENIRNRLMNSGVAVPDAIEAMYHQPMSEMKPLGRVRETLETPRLEKKALNKFRTMVEERMPGFGTGGFGESKSR